MPVSSLTVPALASAALLIATAGLAAVPVLQSTAPGAVTAQSALAPVPLPLTEHDVAQRKAHARAVASTAARAAAEAAAAADKRRSQARASRTRRAAASSNPRTIARTMLAAQGQAGQFGCLDRLWTRESEWRVTARNPSSGAYGIPQSLPASKMASAGSDWRTNARTQIRWGIGYIGERYGSPCAAWAHSESHGWY